MTPDQSREVEEASTLFSQSSSDITSPYTGLAKHYMRGLESIHRIYNERDWFDSASIDDVEYIKNMCKYYEDNKEFYDNIGYHDHDYNTVFEIVDIHNLAHKNAIKSMMNVYKMAYNEFHRTHYPNEPDVINAGTILKKMEEIFPELF